MLRWLFFNKLNLQRHLGSKYSLGDKRKLQNTLLSSYVTFLNIGIKSQEKLLKIVLISTGFSLRIGQNAKLNIF